MAEIATGLGTEIALSALSSVFNKLRSTYLGGDVTPEQIQHLELFLLSKISVFIEEGKSDEFVQSRPHLEKLLQKLQEAALQADDLLDLYQYNQLKNRVSSSSTNFIKKIIPILKGKLACILPKSSSKVNLEKLLTFVDEVQNHPFIKLARTNNQHTQQKCKSSEATTSALSSPYFRRDKQYESIIKLLLDESRSCSDRMINEVPVIVIKGMGGSGKTLTAQHICKDKRIMDYFGEPPMWVHVTADFDVEKLTKKIIESASNEVCPQFTSLEALQTSLKNSMKKRKRFLLVLDDVWCDNKNNWNRLVAPLNEIGEKGSKIIVTTREAGVAQLNGGKENVIILDELESKASWSILKYYAFGNSEHDVGDQYLMNVGDQIINKARSSPLALKVAGSSLRNTTSIDEWEKFLNRDILVETVDLLSFSFQRLPSHLQRCFVYCSLFPKGYIHGEHLLVPLWIAQGYIENTKDELTLEEKGSRYIDDLLSYSFFERDSDNKLVIHDLLHELAERASGKLCHRIENFDTLMEIPESCIHLSMSTTAEFRSIDISDISKLRNLRSLIVLGDASRTNIFRDNTDIFQFLSGLRVLYVKTDYNVEVLHNPHIDQLKHLRFLRLQFDKKLPKSLTKLYYLQFFYLIVDYDICECLNDCRLDGHWCLKPNTLPQGFANLINLSTLKFNGIVVGELDYLKFNSVAIDVGKLESLQNVPAFYLEKDNVNGMLPLKMLPLCGLLRVFDLQNVKSKEDAEKAMLKQKKNLNKLILEWESSPSDINYLETCEEVLEGLEPHQNLKSLAIKGYQGMKIANWMIRRSNTLRLHSLTLSFCKNIREINFLPLGLKEVTVSRCENIREINFLPLGLKEVTVTCCEKLTQLPLFCNTLNKLELFDCPKLMRLQSMPASLERLEVRKCPSLIGDEPLLVEEVAERETANRSLLGLHVDEPLLVRVLVQPQAFSSITLLYLRCEEAKPFPQSIEDHFSEFSSLRCLIFDEFKTLPKNLEELSSLERLYILSCPEVDLLPKLPISLEYLYVSECPKLEANYNEEDGPLHTTISHIPQVDII